MSLTYFEGEDQTKTAYHLNVVPLQFEVSPSKAVRQCWSVVGADILVLQTFIMKTSLGFSEHIGNYKLVFGAIWICALRNNNNSNSNNNNKQTTTKA